MIFAATYILGWLSLDAPALSWPSALAVALATAAVVVMYTTGLRAHGQSPGQRAVLLMLRLGAIACLVIALLHPAWTSQTPIERRPVVGIVLDDSASMSESIPQTQAPPGTPGSPGSPTNSAKATDAVTRYDLALNTLREKLLPTLRKTHDVRLFDVEGRPLVADALPAAAQTDRSPLASALLRAGQNLADQPVSAFVLLSDGREASEDPTAGALDQIRVPVHAVDFLAGLPVAVGPADVAITSVSANRRTIVGNTVKVTVDLATQGQTGSGVVPVTVLDGDRVMAKRSVAYREGEPVQRAELEFVPRRPGQFVYAVQVGSLPREKDLSNNRQTFPLTVRAKALTVLYVDGVLRWEGKFLRQTLALDPDLNVVTSIRTAVPAAGRGSQGLLLGDQLAQIDAVILGDVETTYFSSAEIGALRRWVTESGGGLLLTGGYHSFGPEGFGRSDLRQILPIEFSAQANPQIEQPFNLKLTDEGRESPIFYLTGDRVRDAAFYQALPPLAGCSRIAGVKPGAQVLAVNPQVGASDSASGGLPVMVVQRVGAGRTMVFTVDTTWRWRMVVGGFTGDDSFYRRFWSQLVRYLASGEDESDQNRLIVTTDRTRYKLGQTMNLRVELRPAVVKEKEATPEPAARPWTVIAQAVDESGSVVEVPLTQTSSADASKGTHQFRASLGASRPGRLDLVVRAEPVAGSAQPTDAAAQTQVLTVQVDRADLEAIDPRPSPQWLRQVSQVTGGRTITPDQIEAWAAQLPRQFATTVQTQTRALWRHPILASAFLGLLCIEWILRRRNRLA